MFCKQLKCMIWFMISEEKYHKVHVSSPSCMDVPKVLTMHIKNRIQEFPILNYLHVDYWFL